MKITCLVLFLFLLSTGNGQPAGRQQYDKGMAALAKNNYKPANKWLDEACDKGYNEACKVLWAMWYASDFTRLEAKKKCAARGDADCMYAYALTFFNPGGKEYMTAIYWLTKAGEAGNKQASLALADQYAAKGPIHDTAIAARIYEYWAARSDTGAWCKMLMLQKNNKDALFYIATVYERSKKHEEWLLRSDLYELAASLGHAEASYRRGEMYLYSPGGAAEAKKFFDQAIRLGYPVPEKDLQYAAYQLSPEGKKQRQEIDARNAAIAGSSGIAAASQSASSATGQINKKSCPVCNGTGKISGRYTTESRDWNKKTIVMTDHTTTTPCSRCNGKGFITW